MKIAIIGTGYVGLVTGTCFAEIGNTVTCVDNNAEKIEKLKLGIMPIYEPGLEKLVLKNYKNKQLRFTTDIVKAIEENDVIFSAVGTPPDKDYRADLSAVKSVAVSIGKHAKGNKILVNKSTVPVGTADIVKSIILKHQKEPHPFSVVSNPEFLCEGSAVKDFFHPDRVVIGADDPATAKIMRELYAPLTDDEHPFILMDVKSAEITKYAANSFLATKITFINEIANFCELVGADVTKVARGIGADHRIGSAFLKAGIGYGGSCFPKDVKAIIHTGDLHNFDFRILEAVETINRKQKQKLLIKLHQLLPNIENLKIAIWGLSFKPNTDDVRDAPALPIVRRLAELGAKIHAFDPIATDNFKIHFPHEPNLRYAPDPYTALKGASALIILTDWQEFLEPDFAKMLQLMKKPNIIDGRNIYQPEIMQKLGFTYRSIGRPDVNIKKK